MKPTKTCPDDGGIVSPVTILEGGTPMTNRRKMRVAVPAVITSFALLAAACGSDSDSAEEPAEETTEATTGDEPAEEPAAEGDRSITVALVGNANIEKMAELAPENFTADTGIEVNFTVLDEQTLREVTTRDVGAGGEQFDVVQIGMYETPQFGANGWLVGLNDLAAESDTYDIDDLIPAVRGGLSVDGELYASPFYAESSFVMYRADVMEENGITMPDAPTWEEVADIARQPLVARGGSQTTMAPSVPHRSISPSSPKR